MLLLLLLLLFLGLSIDTPNDSRASTASRILGSVAEVNPDLKNPTFSLTSLTIGKSIGSQGTSDISVLFNEVVAGNIANITVNIS